jgi:threonine dehydrogenase-like Zn-dependent dehydrogenase
MDALSEKTGGRGPDACIDAVGMESHSPGIEGMYDTVKTKLMMETDRPTPLRQAIQACRNGGTVSVPGVYGGFIDKVPIGSVVNRSLTIKSGQTHVHRYLPSLLRHVQNGDIDPSFVVTHRMKLDEAPDAYKMFRDKQDGCVKVVLKPS